MPIENLHRYRAFNVLVHDGDTIICDLDLGFDCWLKGQRFRLFGINAPELSTPEGRPATDALKALIADGGVIEVATFQTRKGSSKREKYGRWLCILYDERRLNLNEEMVKTGFAVEYMT